MYHVPTGTITIDLDDLAILDLPPDLRTELFAALDALERISIPPEEADHDEVNEVVDPAPLTR